MLTCEQMRQRGQYIHVQRRVAVAPPRHARADDRHRRLCDHLGESDSRARTSVVVQALAVVARHHDDVLRRVELLDRVGDQVIQKRQRLW